MTAQAQQPELIAGSLVAQVIELSSDDSSSATSELAPIGAPSLADVAATLDGTSDEFGINDSTPGTLHGSQLVSVGSNQLAYKTQPSRDSQMIARSATEAMPAGFQNGSATLMVRVSTGTPVDSSSPETDSLSFTPSRTTTQSRGTHASPTEAKNADPAPHHAFRNHSLDVSESRINVAVPAPTFLATTSPTENSRSPVSAMLAGESAPELLSASELKEQQPGSEALGAAESIHLTSPSQATTHPKPQAIQHLNGVDAAVSAQQHLSSRDSDSGEQPVHTDVMRQAASVQLTQTSSTEAKGIGSEDNSWQHRAVAVEISSPRHQHDSPSDNASASGRLASATALGDESNSPSYPQVVHDAKLVQQMNRSEWRVGLQVPELGHIEIKSSTRQGSTEAQLAVERPEVHRILAANETELSAALERHNVVFSGTTLMHSSGGNESREQPQSWQSPQPQQTVSPNHNQIQKPSRPLESVPQGQPAYAGGLNILA